MLLPIYYAPLAGCSDFPFRKMSARWKPDMMFCEMVKMDALVRYDPRTFHILDYDASMHPIGAQLCGSQVKYAKLSAKIIEDLGFDQIDFNCGCPVDKVTKDGSGSGMLKHPELIGEILSEIKAAVKIPVSVKIRAGWDEESIVAPLITEIAEKAGAYMITIHGRTREQAYRGSANWDYIKACKDVAKKIKIFGNGDIFDAKSAKEIIEKTNCDGILVARATMGQPWIAEDIRNAFLKKDPIPRSLEFCRQNLLEHFFLMKQYHPERRAVVEMRKVGCWYMKKTSGTTEFRQKMARANSFEEIEHLILTHAFGEKEEFDHEEDFM